jgi:uncharacterized RDD family membrane protein YckC
VENTGPGLDDKDVADGPNLRRLNQTELHLSTPEFPAEETGVPHNLASWGVRAGGLLIDYAPIFIIQILFFRSSTFSGLASLLGILYWVLLGYLDGVGGQTPGKAIMGSRLVDTDGKVIGGGAGIGRKFVHILDSLVCLLGWFLPLVDSKRQTIADKVMTTFVIAGVEKKPFSVDLWMPPKE